MWPLHPGIPSPFQAMPDDLSRLKDLGIWSRLCMWSCLARSQRYVSHKYDIQSTLEPSEALWLHWNALVHALWTWSSLAHSASHYSVLEHALLCPTGAQCQKNQRQFFFRLFNTCAFELTLNSTKGVVLTLAARSLSPKKEGGVMTWNNKEDRVSNGWRKRSAA